MSCASWLTVITAKFVPPVVPTKNVDPAEIPPLAGGLETVMLATPALAMSAESMDACKLVLETNTVVRALPFHCTAEPGPKFFPVTVNVKLALPATAELGLNSVILGGGTLIVKGKPLDAPPPGPGFATVTVAAPTL